MEPRAWSRTTTGAAGAAGTVESVGWRSEALLALPCVGGGTERAPEKELCSGSWVAASAEATLCEGVCAAASWSRVGWVEHTSGRFGHAKVVGPGDPESLLNKCIPERIPCSADGTNMCKISGPASVNDGVMSP